MTINSMNIVVYCYHSYYHGYYSSTTSTRTVEPYSLYEVPVLLVQQSNIIVLVVLLVLQL